MEFVEHPLYKNEDLQLLQVQELPSTPSTCSDDLFDQELLIKAIIQGCQIEAYETASQESPSEKQQKISQPLPEAAEEGVLSEKELKNLKTWKSQGRFGGFIEGTKVLPCKTFLCEERWHPYLNSTEHFHLTDLTAHLEKLGLKIGLILDLNRSTTYYNFEKVKTTCPLLAETRYRKFKLENGTVPCPEAVNEVCGLLKEAHEKDEVVVVHCFNGLNRTGYMICEFMCRHLGLDGETAIDRFEKGRQHVIEHECMKAELREKYPARG